MRFHLIDKITDLVPGKRIEARKNLTLGEEYLADHFPTFPVMPGVLMLEAMVQAGAWLLMATDDFARNAVTLKEVKGANYNSFVTPGFQLNLTVEIVGENAQDGKYVTFKGKGEVDGTVTVKGRFVLERTTLAERLPDSAGIDPELTSYYRRLYGVIRPRDQGAGQPT